MEKCDICGKENSSVELQLSRKQLIFGGYPVNFEYHCLKCRKKEIKTINRILKNLS
jgi:hypothetical protein